MTTLRTRFDGHVLIPEGDVDLPTGTLLELQVVGAAMPPSGENTIAALRRLLKTPSPATEAAVAALEEAIESGKMPVREAGPFDDER